MTEQDWREAVLPGYSQLRQSLIERYNNFGEDIDPSKRNGIRDGTIGGDAFAGTLGLAMNRTRNADAVTSIQQALEAIVDKPYSGATAWEMRRFIRRAPKEFIEPFGILMKELAEKTSEGVIFIDMDFYYWDAEWSEGTDLEDLSIGVLNGLRERVGRAAS